MNCLHCGDCCKRMSPFTGDLCPCPHLVDVNGIYLCSIYDNRPQQCKDHRHPFPHCPIGIDVLKLKTPIEIAQRIDAGWKLIKNWKRGNFIIMDDVSEEPDVGREKIKEWYEKELAPRIVKSKWRQVHMQTRNKGEQR